MFKKNDEALFTARIILLIIIAIFAIAFLIVGFVLAIQIHWIMIFITFVGWLFCWLAWVFIRLYLCYLCDVKLIRNKLYGESNEYLKDFWKTESKVSAIFSVDDELARLDDLLASEEITPEQYEKLKNDLLEGK